MINVPFFSSQNSSLVFQALGSQVSWETSAWKEPDIGIFEEDGKGKSLVGQLGKRRPGDLSDMNKGGGRNDMKAEMSRVLETVGSSLDFILRVMGNHWKIFKQEIGMI